MTKFWYSTCSKILNNENSTHDDKKDQTSKALHYILGGMADGHAVLAISNVCNVGERPNEPNL